VDGFAVAARVIPIGRVCSAAAAVRATSFSAKHAACPGAGAGQAALTVYADGGSGETVSAAIAWAQSSANAATIVAMPNTAV
jgi:hypothetical protein